MSARDGNPKMQRAHFQLIADVVRGLMVKPLKRQQIASDFAARLRSTNPQFNAERFMEACIPPEERE